MENKFILSIWGGIYKELGIYGAIDRFIEMGYHAMEYPDVFTTPYINLPREEYMAEAKKIHDYAKERDFEISQGHLLFHHPYLGDEPLELLKKNIDFLEAVGVKHMVIHISGNFKGKKRTKGLKKIYAKQLARLKELLEYIGDRDIVLCLENIVQNPNTEKSDYIMRYIHDCDDSPHLGICLDTGHLNRSVGLGHVEQTFEEFFKNAEGRIKALHVNGNAGNEDQHLFPYSGKEGHRVDWVDFIKALKNSGYDGLYNYEVPGERDFVPIEIRNMKMRYAKEMFEYMTSDAFLTDCDKSEDTI
ncbi:MAG: sugar phosphate isomerase/epimerase [Clostridia bacterium]|nr:sugar phosphate isomerase/epimerase [Clostridia bacterium]